MLRTALRPWSLGVLLLALLAATAFAALGNWQLERSRAPTEPSATEQVVPLGEVLEPATTFTGRADGQRVTAAGRYLGDEQLLVADRPREGAPGSWVVAPLEVETATGPALLPVLRGWVPAGSAAPAPPSGEVELVGRLQPSEPPRGYTPGEALGALSSADLVNAWDGRLFTGFLVAEQAPAPLSAVSAQAPPADRDLRNVSYALQWWLFAAFAVGLWAHVVRQRHRDELDDLAWEDEQMSQDTEPAPEPAQEARP